MALERDASSIGTSILVLESEPTNVPQDMPSAFVLKKKAPTCGIPELRILSLPLIFGSPGALYPPATTLCPSTQFRKGRGPGHNRRKHYAIFKELPPFRAWVLGVDETAGAWNAPGVPNITGKIGARSPGTTLVGAFFLSPNTEGMPCGTFVGSDSNRGINAPTLDASRSSTIYGASSTVMPPSVNIPVIIYLGRPR